jgi:hypothetical protein
MTSAIEITVLATFLSLIIFAGLTLWRWRQQDLTEEANMEVWECDNCGTVISATTIEALIDGYRIHEQSIYCPRDEEENEE